jgi:hypothetical protein
MRLFPSAHNHKSYSDIYHYMNRFSEKIMLAKPDGTYPRVLNDYFASAKIS